MVFLEFLAVGTWSFWAILAVAAVAMSELLDTNRPGAATAIAIAIVAIFAVLGDFNPLHWMMHNSVTMAEYTAAYFLVGALWGQVKWFFWLRTIRAFLVELKIKSPTTFDAIWKDELYRRSWPMQLPPKVGDHNALIIGWMTLWPSSMIWTLMHDPVKWLFEEIYALLGGMMQRMSNYVFNDIT